MLEDLFPGLLAILSPKVESSSVLTKVPKMIPVFKSSNLFVEHIYKPVVNNVFTTSPVYCSLMPKEVKIKVIIIVMTYNFT